MKLQRFLVVASILILVGGVSHARNIRGTISSTLTIFEDSQLVGNVTCTVIGAPCLKFGAPRIELELNGFIMTGRANPTTGCNPGGPILGEDGINTNDQSHVKIEGPGLVRRFRNHGIAIDGGTGVEVKGTTSSTNCHNGIDVDASNARVTDNVAVRNSSITDRPCGGIEVAGNNNRISGNLTSGNGLFFPCPGCFDFGIGVFGRGNLIEGNRVTGNTPDGIEVFPGATGNTVRGNVAFGNPPIQSTVTNPHFGFADINDENNVTTANTYVDNLCETGGFTAIACNFPRQEREGDDDD